MTTRGGSMRTAASGPAVLERRIGEYHEVTMAEVLDVVAYLRDDGDSVIVGGSLAIGLGNRLSDLDVVVAGRETPASQVPLEHWVKSLRVDVWLRSQRDVDALFERAESALESERPLQGAFGSVDEEQELKLLHRVAFGLHWDGPELVPSTRDYRDIARDLVVREYAERMRESACVAMLAHPAGRDRAAGVNARLAVEEAMQAVLADRGHPWSGDKWLQVRLQEHESECHDLYRPYAVLPEPGSDVGGFVRGAAELAERMTGVELALERLVPLFAWSPAELRSFSLGGERVLVATEPGMLWRLEEAEAAAWERLVDRYGERGPWPAAECDPAEASLAVELYERGVVAMVWSRGVTAAELAHVGERS
ncbi:MAG TPA: nucleotidyltransferase domain-containing protein [Thermoleophilaceae bacterium]|jgi:hypothetical protein